MTDEEREMLREAHAVSKELRDAFFDVPPGSPDGTPNLITDIRVLTTNAKRASWIVRALVYLTMTIAGLGAAIAQIRGWFPWSGK